MATKLKSRKELSYGRILADCKWAKDQQTISFDQKKTSVEEWLKGNKPSKISRQDGIGWIAVDSPNKLEHSPDIEGLRKAWEELRNSKRKITFNLIRDLAKRYNNTGGKWIFYVKTKNVDLTWNLVATNVVKKELGSFCSYAKVSPYHNDFESEDHVLTVHNADFNNEEQVTKIEKQLRQLGITEPLKYKPDIFTTLGIYPKNKWNIIPTIYMSSYDFKARKSDIKKTFLEILFQKSERNPIQRSTRGKFQNDLKYVEERFRKF